MENLHFYTTFTFKSKTKNLAENIIDLMEGLREDTKKERGVSAVNVGIIQVEKVGFRQYLMITKSSYRRV